MGGPSAREAEAPSCGQPSLLGRRWVLKSAARLGAAGREQPRARPARVIVGTLRCAVSGRAPPAHDGWLGAGGRGSAAESASFGRHYWAGCRPGGRHRRLRVHHCQAQVVADGPARFPRTGDETGATARQPGHGPCGPLRAAAPSPSAPGWDQARSNRSRFMTLPHAATKSRTNFSFASWQA